MASNDNIKVIAIRCDDCLRRRYVSNFFTCLACYDTNICEECYETTLCPKREHPYQRIPANPNENVAYICPVCCEDNFTVNSLIEHIGECQPSPTKEFICPICACSHDEVPNVFIEDLRAHLIWKHGPRRLRPSLLSRMILEEHKQLIKNQDDDGDSGDTKLQ